MKPNKTKKILIFPLFWIVLTFSSWAGQVVTQEARQWAKTALEGEKALQVLPGRNTAGVLYFRNKTGQSGLDPLQKGLALMLITDLSSVKGLQVVERIRIQALVEEMGLGASGLVDPDTTPRVGKLLGAQWIVGGDIRKVPPADLELLSSLLDIPGQTIIGQPAVKGELSVFFRMEKDLLFDLIKLFKIEITPEEEAKLRRPCSTKMEALFSLFRGIDASDRGEYEKAAGFYEKALQEDPNICAAAEALEELRNLGRIVGRKKSREMLRTLRGETSLTDQLTPKEPIKRELVPKDISPRPCIDCQPIRAK